MPVPRETRPGAPERGVGPGAGEEPPPARESPVGSVLLPLAHIPCSLACFSAEPADQEFGLGDVSDGPREAPGAGSLRPHGPAPALVLHLKKASGAPGPRSGNQHPKNFLVRFNLRSESLKYAAFDGCLELNAVPLGAGLCRGHPTDPETRRGRSCGRSSGRSSEAAARPPHPGSSQRLLSSYRALKTWMRLPRCGICAGKSSEEEDGDRGDRGLRWPLAGDGRSWDPCLRNHVGGGRS